MGSTDIIRRAFEAADRKIRSASIAEIGGFRPPDDPLTSWFGGRFVASPDSPWPTSANGPMIPLVQIRISELPYVPPAFSTAALAQVFIDRAELPLDLPAPAGEGWAIRIFNELSPLVPQGTPAAADLVRAFPIRWHLSATEGPSWEDAFDGREHEDFMLLPEAIDLFYDRYKNHSRTKVGGWPGWIQSSVDGGGEFVLQIASEEKPRWMAGDNGNLYVFHRSGDWFLYWDCY